MTEATKVAEESSQEKLEARSRYRKACEELATVLKEIPEMELVLENKRGKVLWAGVAKETNIGGEIVVKPMATRIDCTVKKEASGMLLLTGYLSAPLQSDEFEVTVVHVKEDNTFPWQIAGVKRGRGRSLDSVTGTERGIETLTAIYVGLNRKIEENWSVENVKK